MKKIVFPNYKAMVEARKEMEEEGKELTSHVNRKKKEYWLGIEE